MEKKKSATTWLKCMCCERNFQTTRIDREFCTTCMAKMGGVYRHRGKLPLQSAIPVGTRCECLYCGEPYPYHPMRTGTQLCYPCKSIVDQSRTAATIFALRKTNLHHIQAWGIGYCEYVQLLSAQDGRCGICLREPYSGELFFPDGNHEKRIWALLCDRCQSLVEIVGDDPFLAERASSYVVRRAEEKKRAV